MVQIANALSDHKLEFDKVVWLVGSIDTRWQIARRRISSGMLTNEQFRNQIENDRYVIMRLPKWFQRLALRRLIESVKAANRTTVTV